MKIFLAALAFFLLAMLAMAIGVIFSNRRIKGSCGGLNAIRGEDGEAICRLCGKPVTEDCFRRKPRRNPSSPTS